MLIHGLSNLCMQSPKHLRFVPCQKQKKNQPLQPFTSVLSDLYAPDTVLVSQCDKIEASAW